MLDPLHVSLQRKAAGMTQQALAQKAGVSQSLIAKIERGLTRPSYAVMKEIDAVLVENRQKSQRTAKDFLQHKPVFCSPDDKLINVIRLMSQHQYSQVPVRDDGIVGLVTEKEIFTGICTDKIFVHEVMQPPPPIIHSSTTEEIVLSLLDHISLLIVQDKAYVGVITKTDVFRLYRKHLSQNI